MKFKYIYRDAFNMLAGDEIASGAYRTVYECKLRPDLVVKVEQHIDNGYRTFHNVREMDFWQYNEYYAKVANWLAPCRYISPDGHILLMDKATPITSRDKLPEKLPSFLTDIKAGNFGYINNKLVCVDYALNINNPSIRLRKANFHD